MPTEFPVNSTSHGETAVSAPHFTLTGTVTEGGQFPSAPGQTPSTTPKPSLTVNPTTIRSSGSPGVATGSSLLSVTGTETGQFRTETHSAAAATSTRSSAAVISQRLSVAGTETGQFRTVDTAPSLTVNPVDMTMTFSPSASSTSPVKATSFRSVRICIQFYHNC
ncbi:hypothetical protein B0H19DRAFT_1148419 [Mycena capillaripes]|nr:hypothetical protein B0H19DRAFT_1148419 [Mycena capillaripes]